jgi:propionyl-CoA carboxylase alpha chain
VKTLILLEQNNNNFIGPKSKAIHIMGVAAKKAVKAYNIPMVPGLDEAITDIEKSKSSCKRNRLPILIKASAGEEVEKECV